MYYIDMMKKQLEFAQAQRQCMIKSLGKYNQICQDYEHLIESYRYDAAQGAKILSGLRMARIKRRFYKDYIAIMSSVIDNTKKSINNIIASQKRAETHSSWKIDYNKEIRDIIAMKK